MLLIYLLVPLVLPFFFYYCDIIWGDRNNKVLMDYLQILHTKAAKIVLNRPVHSLTTQALIDLSWINLRVRRRIHRLVHIFKCLNGLLDHNYHFNTGSLVHNYQTLLRPVI